MGENKLYVHTCMFKDNLRRTDKVMVQASLWKARPDLGAYIIPYLPTKEPFLMNRSQIAVNTNLTHTLAVFCSPLQPGKNELYLTGLGPPEAQVRLIGRCCIVTGLGLRKEAKLPRPGQASQRLTCDIVDVFHQSVLCLSYTGSTGPCHLTERRWNKSSWTRCYIGF